MFGIKYIANLDNADVEDECSVETAEENCPIAAPVSALHVQGKSEGLNL